MRNGCIYKITNIINNKIYIGQTVQDVNRRWRQHVTMDYKKNYYLGKAIHKYGEKSFKIEVVEICEESKLDEKEKYYINEYESFKSNIGYNVSTGGKTPKKSFPDIDIDYIIDLYVNKHYSLKKVAEDVGCVTWHRIQNLLIDNNIKIRDRHDFGVKYLYSKEEFEEALLKNKSLRSAANYIGISYSSFRKQCIKLGIEYNSPKSPRHPKG